MGTLYTTVGLSVATLITLVPKVGQAMPSALSSC